MKLLALLTRLDPKQEITVFSKEGHVYTGESGDMWCYTASMFVVDNFKVEMRDAPILVINVRRSNNGY